MNALQNLDSVVVDDEDTNVVVLSAHMLPVS